MIFLDSFIIFPIISVDTCILHKLIFTEAMQFIYHHPHFPSDILFTNVPVFLDTLHENSNFRRSLKEFSEQQSIQYRIYDVHANKYRCVCIKLLVKIL